MKERAKAVIIGHARGDALGVPVEFCDRAELDEKPVETMEGYGSFDVPKGSWSDDTSMALATLDSLAKKEVDYEDIMSKFCLWLNNADYTPEGDVFDVGRQTLKSIIKYMDGKAQALDCGLTGEMDNGNGSLMRIHPIVLYLYDKQMSEKEKIEIVHNASSLTHAHERSKMACGIYAFILWELLKNPSLESVTEGIKKARVFYSECKEQKEYSRLFFNIGRAFVTDKEESMYPILSRDEIKSSGYVIDTIESAIWCLMNTSSYKDCVLTAVNLGNDTDTVGAIAGSLAGALYGYHSIPQEWKDTLIKKDWIENLSDKVFGG